MPSAERRQRERARAAAASAAMDPPDSWSALGADTLIQADEAMADAAREAGAAWSGAAAGASGAADQGARAGAGIPGAAQARILRTYVAARAVIGVALAAGMAVFGPSGSGVRPWLLALCAAYALQSIGLWLWPRHRPASAGRERDAGARRRRQWLGTIGVDLLAFCALHVLASDASLNFVPLLVLPVLMAGILGPRLIALGTAAGATLVLLGSAWLASGFGAGSVSQVTQNGFAGLGFFVVALLAGELAARLVREEITARGSMALARQQALLNRLMIEEIADGVLVVDRDLRVRAANPAARRLLAVGTDAPAAPFGLADQPAWAALAEGVRRARAEAYWPDAGADVVLRFGSGESRTLRMRVRSIRRGAAARGAGQEFSVLLLEDVRSAQARMRQERLAAMGRVSAGIAHEIRNPLAAIAQANALMMEDALSEGQQRLARMVAENVERLRRIVDDVMAIAPGSVPDTAAIDARDAVAQAAADWAATAGVALGPGARLRLDLPDPPLRVLFDREHLRRVLVNLLDNALRHSSNEPGAIDVRLAPMDEHAVLLRVASDGPPLDPDVERRLFEPFFSTRSRGSGLGLYICRELCERHGATIEYRLRPDGRRNLFLVVMRRELARLPAHATQP
jgi:two-component system sensor histidine kinase PilS (NtrC family)